VARKSRVVVIDDNQGDLFLVKEALRREGLDCEIVSLRDGAEAIEFLCGVDGVAHCPDCILLDFNLPKVRGDEVLKAIRERPHLADVPILVWSSSLSSGTNLMKDASSLTHFVEKPLELHKFLAVGAKIRSLLEGSPRTE
jgi:two-component system, chemotaxis family, response regulator Rcp1